MDETGSGGMPQADGGEIDQLHFGNATVGFYCTLSAFYQRLDFNISRRSKRAERNDRMSLVRTLYENA